MNNPCLLNEGEWEYVVAVFVSGESAQFDGVGLTPKSIFEKGKGYFLKYYGSKYECTQDWNVKTLVLSRNVRYGDKEVIKTIWG